MTSLLTAKSPSRSTRHSHRLHVGAKATALMFDIATKEQIAKIVEHLADSSASMRRASPLYFYYVVEGLMKVGSGEFALKQLHERYAPMLDSSDSPTLWESWPNVVP